MKKFTEILAEINDVESLDKFDLAEKVFNKCFAQFNIPLQTLKKDVNDWDEKNSYLANQRNFDFYVGKLFALNLFYPNDKRLQTLKQPEVWIQDIKNNS